MRLYALEHGKKSRCTDGGAAAYSIGMDNFQPKSMEPMGCVFSGMNDKPTTKSRTSGRIRSPRPNQAVEQRRWPKNLVGQN